MSEVQGRIVFITERKDTQTINQGGSQKKTLPLKIPQSPQETFYESFSSQNSNHPPQSLKHNFQKRYLRYSGRWKTSLWIRKHSIQVFFSQRIDQNEFSLTNHSSSVQSSEARRFIQNMQLYAKVETSSPKTVDHIAAIELLAQR